MLVVEGESDKHNKKIKNQLEKTAHAKTLGIF